MAMYDILNVFGNAADCFFNLLLILFAWRREDIRSEIHACLLEAPLRSIIAKHANAQPHIIIPDVIGNGLQSIV